MTMRRKFLVAAVAAGLLVASVAGWLIFRQSHAPGPPIDGEMANFTLMDEPRPMPPDEFLDGTGTAGSLADYRGRIVLVNFWATWCLPCKVEMPSLDRLEAALGGADFAVLPISVDRDGAGVVVPFYEETGLENLPVAIDAENAIANALGIQALPTTIVVNRDGIGVGYFLGPAEWDSPEAQALLRWYIDSAE